MAASEVHGPISEEPMEESLSEDRIAAAGKGPAGLTMTKESIYER